ncbi:hypothetical protein GCM10023156_48640 [Novipirellula rosea]|uniref:Uncharacterized protein n=1 Tax=Novipirellula rosea TaxID=1031540 RepID=A0ABP8NCB5_9BACT
MTANQKTIQIDAATGSSEECNFAYDGRRNCGKGDTEPKYSNRKHLNAAGKMKAASESKQLPRQRIRNNTAP